MKEFFKKHWKNILIGVLVLFSLTKCTQSCSSSINNNKLSEINDSLENVIKHNQSCIDSLIHEIEKRDLTIDATEDKLKLMEDHKISDSLKFNKAMDAVQQKQIQIVERVVKDNNE